MVGASGFYHPDHRRFKFMVSSLRQQISSGPPAEKLAAGLLKCAAAVLVTTAVLKLPGVWGGAPILQQADPLLAISTRWVMLGSAVVELALFVLLISLRSRMISGLLLAIVGAEFLLYHVTLAWFGLSGRCPCLGMIWQWMHVSDETAAIISWGLAAFLLLSGIAVLLCHPCPRNSSVLPPV